MNKFLVAFFSLLISVGYTPLIVTAQEEVKTNVYTLKQVVEIAKEESPSRRNARVSLENRGWQYRTYKSNFLPQLTLNGALPDYTQSIVPVLQPNGSIIPQPTHNASSYLQLSLGQEVWFTGAYISINSQVTRFDDFIEGGNRIPKRYTSLPATVTINQPFFNFNYRKWERRTAPMRFEESKRDFLEDMEDISATASDYFFSLLLSQISLQIAKKNVANADTLYKMAQKKFAEGKTPENELLQLELSLLNSRQGLEQNTLDLEGHTLRLKVYLGLTDNNPIRLIPPTEIPQFEVDEKIALQEAHKNREDIIRYERELIEADQRMAQARGETGLNANLFASYGLTQQAINVTDVYRDPSQQQRLRLGFNIPLMDWGRTASKLATAKSNRELVQANIEQQKINFDQDIYLNVKRFKVLRSQMIVAKRADELAERRFVITKTRYLDGQIGILDLNAATEERDRATRSYVTSLRSFWGAYYHLRRITLYDFELDQPIANSVDLPTIN